MSRSNDSVVLQRKSMAKRNRTARDDVSDEYTSEEESTKRVRYPSDLEPRVRSFKLELISRDNVKIHDAMKYVQARAAVWAVDLERTQVYVEFTREITSSSLTRKLSGICIHGLLPVPCTSKDHSKAAIKAVLLCNTPKTIFNANGFNKNNIKAAFDEIEENEDYKKVAEKYIGEIRLALGLCKKAKTRGSHQISGDDLMETLQEPDHHHDGFSTKKQPAQRKQIAQELDDAEEPEVEEESNGLSVIRNVVNVQHNSGTGLERQNMLQGLDDEPNQSSSQLLRPSKTCVEIPEWLRDISKQMLENQIQLQKNQEQLLEICKEKEESRKGEYQQLQSQMQGIVDGHRNIIAIQQDIAQNHLETGFLISALEATTVERDRVRQTMQSQAGKMGAVSKELNAALKENAELLAEKERTVERQEVIDAVVNAVAQVNQNARRAEERIADALQIDDQPLGDPSDNFPYDQWMDPSFPTFKKNLQNIYKVAPKFYKRDDLPPMKDFPDAAKSRLFHLGIGLVLSKPQNYRDLDNSPVKHRHALAMLSGAIFHEDTFNFQKESFESQKKCLCGILCRPYNEDHTVYPMIQGDPFCTPEMRNWKLDQQRKAEFNKFKNNTFNDEYLEIPKYSDDVWWRYFTTLHMTGTSCRLMREEHIANLDRIESGRYYSKATMNAMEACYLGQIADLKREVSTLLPNDKTYENAVKIVVYRATKDRQNDKSTRPKIKNKPKKRS